MARVGQKDHSDDADDTARAPAGSAPHQELQRSYPARPWVGVGVIIMRAGKVLLIQRGRDPGRGLWAVPGGMVDLGETCREAARREAREETGLDVAVEDVFWAGEFISRDAEGRVAFHNVLIDYLATAPEGEAVCADDAMDVRWVGPNDLDDLADMQITPTMWPLLEKLFHRSYAHRYQGDRRD
jgi:ADP-ribose pyrophosphatase YjhB (NUDIX family)